MSADAVAAAVRRYPELAALVRLREAQWWFLPVTTENGQPTELDGFRRWPGGWVDAVRIYSATNVLGTRIGPGEPPPIVWELTDTLPVVVAELLTLPPPGGRWAPRLVIGAAPRLWTP